jgi:hypothetical protein
MHRLILVKPSKYIQLAHLYEHMYCARVAAFLREHGLYARLDYWLTGKTYYNGAIFIVLDLYTPKAVALAKQLPGLPIHLDTAAISAASSQILAEEERPIGTAMLPLSTH